MNLQLCHLITLMCFHNQQSSQWLLKMQWASANHLLDSPLNDRGSENAKCYFFEIPPQNSSLFLPYFKRSET